MIEAIKAIWNGLKWFLGILKALVTQGWGVVTGAVGLAAAIWSAITSGIQTTVAMASNFWDALGGSKTALDTLVSGGVPSVIANACGYLANWMPLNWMLLQVGVMASAFVAAALIRMVKSFVPTVA